MARHSLNLATVVAILSAAAFVIDAQNAPPADMTPLNDTAKVTIVAPDDDKPVALEWTALGDSYASGVGTTKYVDGRQCLRYDEAYPIAMNWNPEWVVPGDTAVLPAGRHKLNNVVCSGAKAQDVLDWQLLDEPTSGKPSSAYGSRPAFGKPEFATLTVGGDDIDFPGILFNCILGIHIIGNGPPKRTCTEQRKYTWEQLKAKTFITEIRKVIDAVMTKGRKGPKGDDFSLYLTGYARFFNDQTTGDETNCDKTTFQINGLFWSPGKHIGANGAKDAFLTQEFRKDANNMADALNAGIEQAVRDYDNPKVKYVDVQTDPTGRDLLEGHRFCEKGVEEPKPGNPDLYFWHFPYTNVAWAGSASDSLVPADKEATFEAAFNASSKKIVDAAGDDINAKYPFQNDFLNAVLEDAATGLSDGDAEIYWGGGVGNKVKTFHPQWPFHKSITTSILTQYALDNITPPNPPDSPTGPSPDPGYATGTCTFHLNEYETCVTDSKNLLADIQLKDGKGNEIGKTDTKDGTILGVAANAEEPYKLDSKLKDPLVVTGEHKGDYVRFTIGDLSWTSNDLPKDGKAGCKKPGGWDPKEGPTCGRAIMRASKRQMDCEFPC